MLAAADAIVVAGASEREDVVGGYGADPTRVAVVPPGVEARFRPSGERSGVVLIGRVQPLKGQLLAVRALAAMPEEARPVLRLVGGAAPGREAYLDEVRGAAAALGDRVLIDGPADRDLVAQRLRSARLALVPSAAETFGLIALEAAASGTPVLARRTTGLRDAVRDGMSGMLIDSDSPVAWADAMLGLLGAPGSWPGSAAAAWSGRRPTPGPPPPPSSTASTGGCWRAEGAPAGRDGVRQSAMAGVPGSRRAPRVERYQGRGCRARRRPWRLP